MVAYRTISYEGNIVITDFKHHIEVSNGGETEAQVFSELLWNMIPDILAVLQETPLSKLDQDDLLAFMLTSEVLKQVKEKPAVDSKINVSFERESDPEKVIEPVGGPSGMDSGEDHPSYATHIPEYIKGNAKISCQFDKKHGFVMLYIDIDFAEILGSMQLPEEMPTHLSVNFGGTFSDRLARVVKSKKSLPNVMISYFLHRNTEMTSKFMHLYLAPSNMPVEAIEDRLLSEHVIQTDLEPLDAILEARDLVVRSERIQDQQDRVLNREDTIQNLGQHAIQGMENNTSLFLVDNSKSVVTTRPL